MRFPKLALRIAALALALAGLDATAAQRAFVRSTGNDANVAAGCTPAAPCRSFQAAHTAVDAGGEIVALDTAGYGYLVISKSVSVLGAPGVVARVTAASGDAIFVATPGVSLVLRNLNITGVGAHTGLRFTQGAALTIENCIFANFTNQGIFVDAPARVRVLDTMALGNDNGAVFTNNASVEVSGSQFSNNTNGLAVWAPAAGAIRASVTRSVASNNQHGFVSASQSPTGTVSVAVTRSTAANNLFGGFGAQAVGAGTTALLTVSGSLASGNGTGLLAQTLSSGVAVIESLGDNVVRNNGAATAGTINVVPSL